MPPYQEVEAFPCSRENARTVVKILAKEIISRHRIPIMINTDKQHR